MGKKEKVIQNLKAFASKEKAEVLKRFFKTGKGEYAEGDVFIGITVPNIRSVCKKFYKELSLDDLDFFISNPIHEYRLFALICCTYSFERADGVERENIFNWYLKNIDFVNNWDLVDLSCHEIVGEFLKGRDRKVLYDLIGSGCMWYQRIAIVSTYSFIRENDFKEILFFAKKMLCTEYDLIQKAVGWMLREVGKRDVGVLKEFLDMYCEVMPRIMLRYSIERFDHNERKRYLGR